MLFEFPMKMPLTSPLLVLFLGESGTRNDNNTRNGVLEVWHSDIRYQMNFQLVL